MKIKRKIIEIDQEKCTGCGQCIISCAEGALEIVDGKARLVAEKYCDGLGACLGECPEDALKVIEREADDFDEEAVEDHLSETAATGKPEETTLPCGCPSMQLKTFDRAPAGTRVDASGAHETVPSTLRHWPVQIRLIPANASFLKNADLVVAADCTPVAYPSFHRDFIDGRVIMLGCPKFDDAQLYVEKFAEIFSVASIKSVTVVVMEVPCCAGLPMIVKKGMELAGKSIPMEKVVISARGDILKKDKLGAVA